MRSTWSAKCGFSSKSGAGVPLDVDGVHRVADVPELDLGAAVDQQRVGVLLDGLESLAGVEVFHGLRS
jgi:hypothetical protein